ncbi:MAG TPA: PspC domain-containing protein, partial [Actinopolymorphaceae bacterium]
MADHLGLDPLYTRLGFVFLSMLGGIGVLLYAALWVVLRQEPAVAAGAAPGMAAATRRGMRRPRRRRQDVGQVVAVTVLAIGVVLFAQTLGGISGRVFWPLIVGGLGIALLWR